MGEPVDGFCGGCGVRLALVQCRERIYRLHVWKGKPKGLGWL